VCGVCVCVCVCVSLCARARAGLAADIIKLDEHMHIHHCKLSFFAIELKRHLQREGRE
jgi:hypothetical protein